MCVWCSLIYENKEPLRIYCIYICSTLIPLCSSSFLCVLWAKRYFYHHQNTHAVICRSFAYRMHIHSVGLKRDRRELIKKKHTHTHTNVGMRFIIFAHVYNFFLPKFCCYSAIAFVAFPACGETKNCSHLKIKYMH